MTENYKAELNLLTRQGLLCLLSTPFTVSNLDQNLLPPRVANTQLPFPTPSDMIPQSKQIRCRTVLEVSLVFLYLITLAKDNK